MKTGRSVPTLALASILTVAAGLSGPIAVGGPARAEVGSGGRHSFDITYRGWGPVMAQGAFRPADGYAARFEGCFAKKSEEAICAFTIRADRAVAITNVGNLSHGSGGDGSALRTCCLFVQGDDKGYPILPGEGVATYARRLEPGQTLGVMLRVPGYAKAQPLTAITFSRGERDKGVSFPAHLQELP